MALPPQKKAAKPAPTPPRAALLMDAPTNTLVASYLIQKGYSVEIIRDLKYCSTQLLKSSKYIFLGPNHSKSPYYDKIKLTLKKMVPQRLFEQSGQELLDTVREKISESVQPSILNHPNDGKLQTEKRELADQKSIDQAPPPEPVDSKIEANQFEALKALIKNRPLDDNTFDDLSQALQKIEPSDINFEIDEDLIPHLNNYLSMLSGISQLEAERSLLLQQDDLPEDAKSELQKQSQTAFPKKPLTPDRILQKAEQIEEKKKAAEAEGKEFPPRKLPEGELYDQLIEMSSLNDNLISEKAKMRYSLADYFVNQVCADRHYKIFRSIGVDASYLYGSLYLHLSLQTYQKQLIQDFKSSYKKLKSILPEKSDSGKKSGIGGFFKKKEAEADQTQVEKTPEQITLEQKVVFLGFALKNLNQEIATFEPDLCNHFWNVYESLSLLILQNKVQNESFLRYIRAYMRFGLMSDHPAIISKQQKDILLNLSSDDLSDFKHQKDATNIVFPDESLVQISKGVIPPSFDEELELNGQGTPKYKYDKIARKIYASQYKILIYSREISNWEEKINRQKETIESSEKMLTEHEKGTKEYKLVQSGMREAKAETTRLSKIVEKLNDIITTEKETVDTQNENLKSLGSSLDLKDLASNETKTIRKFCKLLSNLKEDFLPFVLRDSFKPDLNNLYTREVMGNALHDFEQNDPTIFSTDLVNAQNPRKQVLIRFSPTIMIYPCLGTMGFCVAPSNSADTGRVVQPLMSSSQSPLPRMLIDAFADFRYDTAKENAGVDLMTSDTICAAYAKVRWDYRKKGKEFREKAGIYNDMQDKKNFKVHYRLYIESMDESGKKLFFKCHEMYEGFVKYIPLPKGKEKLQRG